MSSKYLTPHDTEPLELTTSQRARCNSKPPTSLPSCTTAVFFSVSTVISAFAPVKMACSEVVPFQDEPRIKLNVGGIVFETFESVLSRDPDSMLAALCREDSPLKAEAKEEQEGGDGNQSMVFIDRSGKLFP